MNKFLHFKHRLLLALLAAFLAVPQAWADITTATELQAAIDNAAEGGTVQLTQDITADQVITINKALTLDLNGHTLSGTITNDSKWNSTLYSNKTLLSINCNTKNVKIIDSSTKKSGKISATGTEVNFSAIILHYGLLTIDGSTISANCTNGMATGISFFVEGAKNELNVNDGAKIEATTNTTRAYGINTLGFSANPPAVNINGGTITANGGTDESVGILTDAKTTISGNASVEANASNNGLAIGVDVRASVSNNTTCVGTLDLQGGQIKATADQGKATGILVRKSGNASSTFTMTGGGVNSTTRNGESHGVESNGKSEISGGSVFASNENGAYAYGVYSDSVGSSIVVSNSVNIESQAKRSYSIFVDGGELTVKGGTISGTNTTSSGDQTRGIYVKTGSATITGGTITATPAIYSHAVYIDATATTSSISGGYFNGATADVYNATTTTLSISGGYFVHNTNISNYLAYGKAICAGNSDYPYQVATAVAQIGTTNYATLQDAINAATNGQTVTLLTDETVGNSIKITNKTIVLNLGGKILTSTDLDGLTINGSNVTVKNGTISTTKENEQYAINAYNGTNLTVDNDVTINATQYKSCCFNISNVYYDNNDNPIPVPDKANTLTINGGTFNSGTWDVAYLGANNKINIKGGTFKGNSGVSGNGSTGLSGNVVTITGGTFEVAYDTLNKAAQGMYFPNNDSVTIDSCTIIVKGLAGQGIVVRAGTVELGKAVTINNEANDYGTAGDKKTSSLPSAVVVFDATNPDYPGLKETNGVATVKIAGGNYTSATKPVLQVVTDGTHTSKYIEVSGGTFSSAIDEDYCAADYVPALVGGKYTVATADTTNAIYYIAASDGANGTKQYLTGKTITITDGAYYSFNVPAALDGKTKNITYTRNFKNTNIQPWFVPFAVDAKDYSDKVTFYAILDEVNSSTGLPQYKAIDLENDSATIIKANTPYFVSATTIDTITFVADSAKITSTVNPGCKTITGTSDTYIFTGIYVRKPYQDGDSWYALNGGTFYKAGTGNYLTPFRVFLTQSSNTFGSKPNSIGLFLNEGDDITGINSVAQPVATDDDNAVIYNLQGQRVTNPSKGIYIINGKKVIIK